MLVESHCGDGYGEAQDRFGDGRWGGWMGVVQRVQIQRGCIGWQMLPDERFVLSPKCKRDGVGMATGGELGSSSGGQHPGEAGSAVVRRFNAKKEV